MSGPGLGLNVGPPDAGARFIGVQKVATVPAPAAGADWTYRVDAGTWQRILSLSALLTSSAAVANRTVRTLIADADGNPLFEWAAGAAQTAGLVVRYSASVTPVSMTSLTSLVSHSPLPALWLPAGFQVAVSTQLLDAGDQWSAVRVLVEEIDRGPLGEQIGTDTLSLG